MRGLIHRHLDGIPHQHRAMLRLVRPKRRPKRHRIVVKMNVLRRSWGAFKWLVDSGLANTSASDTS